MDVKIREIEIDENTPFSNDAFNRRSEIENLSNLVMNIATPIVMSINSEWGTGKTTFIKMWKAHLKNQGYFPLYFNAWESDFTDDPLVSFLGEMNSALDDYKGNNEEEDKKTKESWQKVKNVGKHLITKGVPIAAKILTSGLLDLDAATEKSLSTYTEGLTKDAILYYEETKSAIAEFKVNLKDFIKNLDNVNSIIIFIDELDRCRPTYALELLERLKHLLGIEGIVFILALDKNQLSNSVKSVYGSGIDANGYLRKFIDFEYQLKQPDINSYIRSFFNKSDLISFFKEREKYTELNYDQDNLITIFIFLSEKYKLTLREIEQFFSRLYLVILSTEYNVYLHAPLLVFLTILRDKNKPVYDKYLLQKSSPQQAIEYLYSDLTLSERLRSNEVLSIESYLIAAKLDRYPSNNDHLLPHKNILDSDTHSKDEQNYSRKVIDRSNYLIEMGRDITLSSLVDRIEFLSQFRNDAS